MQNEPSLKSNFVQNLSYISMIIFVEICTNIFFSLKQYVIFEYRKVIEQIFAY